MTPIINPMWFYWLNVLTALKYISLVGVIVCGILFVICGIIYASDRDAGDDSPFMRKAVMRLCIVFVSLVIAAIFIPSQETLVTMKVAEYATYENAEIAIDAIKSAAQYIIEAIGEAG